MADVNVTFAGKDQGLSAAFSNVQKQAEGMKAGVVGALAVFGSLAAGTAYVKAIADEFGRVRDLSEKFGESAESIQRLGFAAKQSGADIEVIAASIGKATRNAQAATDPNSAMAASFAKLGINAAEFVNLPIEEKLAQLSAGFTSIKGAGDQLILALEVLGKSGGDLLPLLKQGPDALRQSMESATVATQAQIEKMDDLADRLDAIKAKVGVEVGGAAVGVVNVIEDIGAGIGDLLALASGVPLADVQESSNQRVFEKQVAEQKVKEPKKPVTELESAMQEIAPLAARTSEFWDMGIQRIKESAALTDDFSSALTPAAKNVEDIAISFFSAATNVEGLSAELDASLKLSAQQANIAEKEANSRDKSVQAVQALKQEIASQKENLSAAQTQQAAAQQQLQTIAGAAPSARERAQQNRPIRAGAIGERATRIKAAQTAERLSSQAEEARALNEPARAAELESKAAAARKKAFGETGGPPEDKLTRLNKTVDDIKALIDTLEKKLPTNSLVP